MARVFTHRMPFFSPVQQCESTEWLWLLQASLGGFYPLKNNIPPKDQASKLEMFSYTQVSLIASPECLCDTVVVL